MAPRRTHENRRVLFVPPFPTYVGGDVDFQSRMGHQRAERAITLTAVQVPDHIVAVQSEAVRFDPLRVLQRDFEFVRLAEGLHTRNDECGGDLALRPSLRPLLAAVEDRDRGGKRVVGRAADVVGREGDGRTARYLPPHRRCEEREDARRSFPRMDAGGRPDEVPGRHGDGHDPLLPEQAKEAVRGNCLVRQRGEGWPRAALRASVRRQAEPVPREVLPHNRRLVRQNVVRGFEGPNDHDALRTLLPVRSLLVTNATRRLFPRQTRWVPGHLGLVLSHERRESHSEGLRPCNHLNGHAESGRAARNGRQQRYHHVDAAVRRADSDAAEREGVRRRDLRPRDQAGEEPGGAEEGAEAAGRAGPGGG
mmetsp:Transcript_1257/g.2799  ORF Transcript_1257/g.2799 Transcript_1257/m.2799 type:complete len:365 (-) Transcript_1257:808-1902(-)